MPSALTVAFLPASTADDADAMSSIAAMVNDVYTVADAGLWALPFERTHPDELARHVRAGELAVATACGQVVGSVLVRRVDDATGEFGMLAAAGSRQGVGVGRELLRFAERAVADSGRSVVELELMRPRDGPHPAKDFLAAWYARLGYRTVGAVDLVEVHPGLGERLARPCDFLRYRKQL